MSSKHGLKLLIASLASLFLVGWTDIREDCELFGYVRTDRIRYWNGECAAPGDSAGPADRITIWFDCRLPNQSIVGRGYRWAKCLNGVQHISSGNAYQANSSTCILTNGACEFDTGGLADVQLRVGSETPEGLLLRALIARAQSVRQEVINAGGPTLEGRLLIVTAAELFVELGDAGFAIGDVEEGAQAVSVARRLLDVASDFTPGVSFAKDAAIIVTGENPVTGEIVSDAERAFTLATLVAPSFLSGGAKALIKVSDHLSDVAEAATPIGHVAGDLLAAVRRADADLLPNVPNLPCTPVLGSFKLGTFAPAAAGPPCKPGEIVAAVADAAAANLDFLRRQNTGFGTAVRVDYVRTFREHYPEYVDAVGQVHHAVEQTVLTRYPGVVTEAEMHSLQNLRGIPKGAQGTQLHQGQIQRIWREFYDDMARQGRIPDKAELLNKAKQIDDLFGKQFIPRVR